MNPRDRSHRTLEVERAELEEEIRKTIEHINDLVISLGNAPEGEIWEKFVELFKQVSYLKTLQTPHKKNIKKESVFSVDYTGFLSELLVWLKKNGAKVDGIVCDNKNDNKKKSNNKQLLRFVSASPEEGNGVFVTRDVKKGDLLFQIPRKLMITSETISQHYILNTILRDDLIGKLESLQLVLFLMFEKITERSFWKPYLDSLPKSYPSVYYWDLDQIRMVKRFPVLFRSVISVLCTAAKTYYETYLLNYAQDLIPKHLFTYDLFIWALSAVYSRQNTVPSLASIKTEEFQNLIESQSSEKGSNINIKNENDIVRINEDNRSDNSCNKVEFDNNNNNKNESNNLANNSNNVDDNYIDAKISGKVGGKTTVIALIPGYDMFNHAFGDNTSTYLVKEGVLRLTAMQDFSSGNQAYMWYGARSNLELLLYQGFVPNLNPHDNIVFYSSIPESDIHRGSKIQLLKQLNINPSTKDEFALGLVKDKILHITWVFLNILACRDVTVLTMENLKLLVTQNRPFDESSKNMAKNLFKLKCQQIINEIPEGVDRNYNDIKKSLSGKTSLDDQIHLAIYSYFISQKEILDQNLKIIEEY